VEDYVRYRPGYPPGLFSWLKDRVGLDASSVVADIGSGTGILTRMFVDGGCQVCAVEPNDAMRAAAERELDGDDGFVSIAGRAEETGLPDQSVDLVIAAQAFHWFDPPAARREFERVLKPPGWTALVWNTRQITATPFMHAYEELLVERAVDYTGVDHRNALAGIGDFLGPHTVETWTQSNALTFDEALGRMLSASYVPAPQHSGHNAIREGLRDIVAAHGRDGRVEFVYTTELYLATILENA